MFDTNLLVKFTFIYNKEDKGVSLPKRLAKLRPLLTSFEKLNFLNIMTRWNELELRDILMKLKLDEIILESGYTVKEFADAEENIRLNKGQIDGVNMIILSFFNHSEHRVEPMKDEEMDMNRINKLSQEGFSTFDIILIYQAELNKCEYFVTLDKDLYLSKMLEKEFKVKIISAKNFMQKIEH
jgi:hypothetical protein